MVGDHGSAGAGASHDDIARADHSHTIVGRAAHGHREGAAGGVSCFVKGTAGHRGDTWREGRAGGRHASHVVKLTIIRGCWIRKEHVDLRAVGTRDHDVGRAGNGRQNGVRVDGDLEAAAVCCVISIDHLAADSSNSGQEHTAGRRRAADRDNVGARIGGCDRVVNHDAGGGSAPEEHILRASNLRAQAIHGDIEAALILVAGVIHGGADHGGSATWEEHR